MPNLIGIPIIKGNSHEIVSCTFLTGAAPTRGQAVELIGGSSAMPDVAVTKAASTNIFGFVSEVDELGKSCAVITKGLMIPVMAKAANTAAGAAKVDLATGTVSATGFAINGEVVSVGEKVCDMTGGLIANAAYINLTGGIVNP